jgi:hypothetical protein
MIGMDERRGPVLELHWAMPSGHELWHAMQDCAQSLTARKVEAHRAEGIMLTCRQQCDQARAFAAQINDGCPLNNGQLALIRNLATQAQEARFDSQREASARSLAVLGQTVGASLREAACEGTLHLDSDDARKALAIYVDLRSISYDVWGTFHGMTYECALWRALLLDERGRVPLDLFADRSTLDQIDRLVKTWEWARSMPLGEGRRVRKRERIAFEEAVAAARSSLRSPARQVAA